MAAGLDRVGTMTWPIVAPALPTPPHGGRDLRLIAEWVAPLTVAEMLAAARPPGRGGA